MRRLLCSVTQATSSWMRLGELFLRFCPWSVRLMSECWHFKSNHASCSGLSHWQPVTITSQDAPKWYPVGGTNRQQGTLAHISLRDTTFRVSGPVKDTWTRPGDQLQAQKQKMENHRRGPLSCRLPRSRRRQRCGNRETLNHCAGTGHPIEDPANLAAGHSSVFKGWGFPSHRK
ncbi:hypothetical protein BDV10DRAFT_56073 [Aspergillus recurvatus]